MVKITSGYACRGSASQKAQIFHTMETKLSETFPFPILFLSDLPLFLPPASKLVGLNHNSDAPMV